MNVRTWSRLPVRIASVLAAAVFATGCELKNYSGRLPAADVFVVHTAPPVMMSLRPPSAGGCSRSLRDRGRFQRGPVTFTAVMLEQAADDEDCPVIENRRTISFTGTAGRRYRLSPVPKPGTSLLDLPSPKAYSGYLLQDAASGAIVARIP